MRTSDRLNWVVAGIGAWQLMAPIVLGYGDVSNAVWNGLFVGFLLAAIALWSVMSKRPTKVRTLNWANAVIGLWLIVAPFVLRYPAGSLVRLNSIVVGLLVAGLATWAALAVGSQEAPRRG